jgi:hypothetical protein
MTRFEQIRNDRAWRGATIAEVEYVGRPAWRLTPPSGAVAYVYKGAGSVQIRHGDAYQAAIVAREQLARDPHFREKERRQAIAHFEQLSGMKMEVFP